MSLWGWGLRTIIVVVGKLQPIKTTNTVIGATNNHCGSCRTSPGSYMINPTLHCHSVDDHHSFTSTVLDRWECVLYVAIVIVPVFFYITFYSKLIRLEHYIARFVLHRKQYQIQYSFNYSIRYHIYILDKQIHIILNYTTSQRIVNNYNY